MSEFIIPLPDPNVPGWASFSGEDPPIYRWALHRNLGGSRPLVVCGLNSSIADARANDPTIRREIGFAKLWGFGWLVKANAYGFRTPSPRVLEHARDNGVDVVGERNDAAIRAAARLCREHDGMFLGAWGAHIEPARALAVYDIIKSEGVEVHALGLNQGGTPKHTLYMPSDAKPTTYRPATRAA